MRRAVRALALVLALVVAGGVGWWLGPRPAAPLSPPFAAANLSDAPTLAGRGDHAVGVMTLTLVNPDQPNLLDINPLTHNVPNAARHLDLLIWYPARLTPGQREATFYRFAAPQVPDIPADSLPATLEIDGHAARDATPEHGAQPWPLLVFSHGFRNFAAGYAQLAENLASKGYVVAAIDHHDAETGPLLPVELAFGHTVVTRAADQRFVIAELTRRVAVAGDPLAGLFDPTRIGLMGYSMGGFGALVTMGAGLDTKAPLYPRIPSPLLDKEVAGSDALQSTIPAGVKALVAFAPWGGGSKLRAWSAAALTDVHVPSLFIVGDHDDVSGFDDGVKWVFDNLTGSDRHMLIYQGAHHNIAGDPVPPQLAHYFQFVERYEEPVWRRDRILAINAHFITAFLDAQLKGSTTAAAYLQVPTVRAADGVWNSDKPVGAARALPGDPAAAGYWPGFQRRWALGLELHHAAATTP